MTQEKRCTALIDLTGKDFGRLTVIERAANSPNGHTRWLCQCQCGKRKVVLGSNLRRGLIQSCRCLHHERTRDTSAVHGYWGTAEFNIWRGILRRCNKPKAKCYDTHGGRGIRCLWDSCQAFLDDMGERPSPQHRLFRVDRDGHFEPSNCVWMIPKEYFRQYGYTPKAPLSTKARRNQRRSSAAVPGCPAAAG